LVLVRKSGLAYNLKRVIVILGAHSWPTHRPDRLHTVSLKLQVWRCCCGPARLQMLV
jgi:hypothetical protein